MQLIGGMGISHGESFFLVGTPLGQHISFCLVAPALIYSFKYHYNPLTNGNDMYSSVCYPTAESS